MDILHLTELVGLRGGGEGGGGGGGGKRVYVEGHNHSSIAAVAASHLPWGWTSPRASAGSSMGTPSAPSLHPGIAHAPDDSRPPGGQSSPHPLTSVTHQYMYITQWVKPAIKKQHCCQEPQHCCRQQQLLPACRQQLLPACRQQLLPPIASNNAGNNVASD